MADLPSVKKLTQDAKANVLLAFDDLGGVERLKEWANAPGNLTIFYTQIWAKVIPRDVKAEHTGKDGGPITVTWQMPALPQTDPQLNKEVDITPLLSDDAEEAEVIDQAVKYEYQHE